MIYTSLNAKLQNAFRPGVELDEPSLFAGREKQIEELAKALNAVGSCPNIYGDGGLGKSSLALQTWLIAQGQSELLIRHGFEGWALSGDDTYLAFYVPCTDATSSTGAILERVANSLSSVQVDPKDQLLIDRTTRREISLKIFSAETTKRYAAAKREVVQSPDVEERLTALAATLSETYGRRVLVLIDELDRVHDTSGLAAFVKANSTESLKFLLVGIAQNVSSLLDDHQSLERKAIPILVERMKVIELESIITRAVKRLRDDGVDMAFTDDASKMLAERAAGFPWFVHVIGQQALVKVGTDGRSTVEKTDVAQAMSHLTKNRFAQHFDDLYHQAVRDSTQREKVLRAFAEWKGRDIPTTEVYRKLKRTLGVSNPSIYKGHLMQSQFGRVLLTPPHQTWGLVRFANEMWLS
jgi:histone H3/H4